MTSPIKNHIQEYRIFYKLTQEELAKELNITLEHLLKLEAQRQYPSVDLMSKVCKFFKVQLTDIFYIDRRF